MYTSGVAAALLGVGGACLCLARIRRRSGDLSVVVPPFSLALACLEEGAITRV